MRLGLGERGAVTCAGVTPGASRSAPTSLAVLIRLPTTPTLTSACCVVSSAPPAPRIGARVGQSRTSSIWSPACSAGLIVAGAHATSQWPLWSVSLMVVRVVQSPAAGRANRATTSADAREPDCLTRPADSCGALTPRFDSASALSASKSAGGSSACRLMATKS